MNPVILFRNELSTEEEFLSAQSYFPVFQSRMDIKENSLVIGRYSVLPYYKELERDLSRINSRLINNYLEHDYIASMTYVLDIEEYTPKTYWHPQELPQEDKEYVVKGRTNSRKQQWKEKMFASNKKEAMNIYQELMNDPLIAEQGVVFREYVPLKNYGISLNGMPFSDEWRFFYYKENILSYNFYWTSSEYIPKKEDLPKEAVDFANKVAKIVSKRTNFFVLDIARTEKGDWIVIELNDGQMSGLSENDPNELYSELSNLLG